MKPFDRMARLRRLLHCDLVLSDGQLQRLGLNPEGLPAVTRTVQMTQSPYSLRTVTFYARNHPDALWHTDQGEISVEYDARWYRAGTIREKMRALQSHGEVVWGTSSALRVERMKQQYPLAQIVLVRWWEDQQDRAFTAQECRGSLKAARIARLQASQ